MFSRGAALQNGFQNMPRAGDDDGSPHAGKHTSSKPKSSRRKDRAQQKSVSASKPATEAVQQRTGAAADAAEDASESLDEEDEADNQSQDDKDGSAVSSDSERDSDGTATSTSHDESDIASDLEGLPVASVVGTAGPSAKRQKKKAKASPSQVITEAGMASKLGVAFSRVLERSSKQGIMQVWWSKSLPDTQPLARPYTTVALSLLAYVYLSLCREANRCKNANVRRRPKLLKTRWPSKSAGSGRNEDTSKYLSKDRIQGMMHVRKHWSA